MIPQKAKARASLPACPKAGHPEFFRATSPSEAPRFSYDIVTSEPMLSYDAPIAECSPKPCSSFSSSSSWGHFISSKTTKKSHICYRAWAAFNTIFSRGEKSRDAKVLKNSVRSGGELFGRGESIELEERTHRKMRQDRGVGG